MGHPLGAAGAGSFSDVSAVRLPSRVTRVSSSVNPSNPAALARGQRRPFGPSAVPHGDFEGMEESTPGRWPWPGHRGALCRTVLCTCSTLRRRAGGGESVSSPSLSEPDAAPTRAQGELFSLLLLVRGDHFLAVRLQLVAYVFFVCFFVSSFFYVSYIAYQFWKIC